MFTDCDFAQFYVFVVLFCVYTFSGFTGMTNDGACVKLFQNIEIREIENPNKEMCKMESGDIIKICWELKYKNNVEMQMVYFYKNNKKLEIPKKFINFKKQRDCFCLCVMYYGYNDPIEFIDENVYFS